MLYNISHRAVVCLNRLLYIVKTDLLDLLVVRVRHIARQTLQFIGDSMAAGRRLIEPTNITEAPTERSHDGSALNRTIRES
jgi:hypothetical protein